MQGPLIPVLRRAPLLALALLTLPAGALEIGEIEVRSALGEPLDARVSLAIAKGEYIHGSCFSLLAPAEAIVPAVSDARLSVHTSSRGRKVLRIRSSTPMTEPALALRVRAACPRQATESVRDFTVLLDPRNLPSTITPPSVAARLNAGAGDTLQSVANTIFPRERAAQSRYLAALRAANPALAAYGENEPLPQGTTIALPDLRASLPPRRARRSVQVAAREDRPRASSAAEQSAPRMAPAKARPAPAPASTAAPDLRAASPFVLRLSAPQADLSRSRGMDDRSRAQLRERRLVLDSDDQVAALLAMRHNLKQLESRIAELQLKLSTLPQSPEAPKVEVAKVEAPKPEAPKVVEAPKPEAPKVEAPKPEASKVEASRPVAPKIDAPPTAKALPAKAPAEASDWIEGVRNEWLLAGLAILLVIIAMATWFLRRRGEDAESPEPVEPTIEGRFERLAEDDSEPAAAGAVPGGRAQISSDAGLSTRLPENSRELRRRYIEERFPEIANRTLVLDQPSSVIKAARLFYEDGALTRAIELLQYCIEENPREVRFWLALFEIFRLERLTGEFAELARRFHQQHGNSEYWRKVQYFGREIDPANLLYKEEALSTLETIGPSQARGLAAAASFDPIEENWLEAPMDFENEVLANELRKALMAQAGLKETDLQANPMPVLRNAEMFTVA